MSDTPNNWILNDTKTILPPDTELSFVEQRKFNRLSHVMEQFHNHFRQEFNEIYEIADGKFEQLGLSLPAYLSQVTSFKRHLEGHHGIEEAYIFPRLALRMKEFEDDEKHKTMHKDIHVGLDKLDALVRKWRVDPKSYSPTELRECLDSWREVLFQHLDQEVEDLKGSNMQKHWTLDEMDQFMI